MENCKDEVKSVDVKKARQMISNLTQFSKANQMQKQFASIMAKHTISHKELEEAANVFEWLDTEFTGIIKPNQMEEAEARLGDDFVLG